MAATSTEFSILPTEMKTNVFAFILRNKDSARACLVSREWRSLMAPLLWETLTVYTDSGTSEKLAILLHPHNGVLPHVRFIRIDDHTHTDESNEYRRDAEVVVLSILAALPRNMLRGFHSCQSIGVTLFLQLLQCQQTMEKLTTFVDIIWYEAPFSFNIDSYAAWLVPALANLQTLGVSFRQDEPDTYKFSSFLVQNAPRLKELTIDCYT